MKTYTVKKISSKWEKIDIKDRGDRDAVEIINNGQYPFYFCLGRNESKPHKNKGRIIKSGEISAVGMHDDTKYVWLKSCKIEISATINLWCVYGKEK